MDGDDSADSGLGPLHSNKTQDHGEQEPPDLRQRQLADRANTNFNCVQLHSLIGFAT